MHQILNHVINFSVQLMADIKFSYLRSAYKLCTQDAVIFYRQTEFIDISSLYDSLSKRIIYFDR